MSKCKNWILLDMDLKTPKMMGIKNGTPYRDLCAYCIVKADSRETAKQLFRNIDELEGYQIVDPMIVEVDLIFKPATINYEAPDCKGE